MKALEHALELGAQAWPGVRVTHAELAAHLGSLLPEAKSQDDAVSTLHAEDLYLACACARGDHRAIAAFDEKYVPLVAGYVARVTREPGELDEIRQRLREKLFVATEAGGRPKICDYRGRGPLGAWLRVVALRLALDLKRRGPPSAEVEVDDGLRGPALDPELNYLRARYREEFRAAIEATLSGLSLEQRNLLKLHYLDGLNIDEIGIACRVHRSTAARRIAQTRTKVLEETRRRLAERSGLKGAELDSLLGLVRSQLDVSISRVLKG